MNKTLNSKFWLATAVLFVAIVTIIYVQCHTYIDPKANTSISDILEKFVLDKKIYFSIFLILFATTAEAVVIKVFKNFKYSKFITVSFIGALIFISIYVVCIISPTVYNNITPVILKITNTVSIVSAIIFAVKGIHITTFEKK